MCRFHFRCIDLTPAAALNIQSYFCEICTEVGAGVTQRKRFLFFALLPLARLFFGRGFRVKRTQQGDRAFSPVSVAPSHAMPCRSCCHALLPPSLPVVLDALESSLPTLPAANKPTGAQRRPVGSSKTSIEAVSCRECHLFPFFRAAEQKEHTQRESWNKFHCAAWPVCLSSFLKMAGFRL